VRDLPPLDIPPGPIRLGDIDARQYDDAQRRAAASLISSPRGEVRGPFMAMLRSPELTDRTQQLGAFLRYRCSVPERLREWTILITARIWQQTFEWAVHAPLALAAGVSATAIVALAGGREPVEAAPDERAIYAFAHDLHCAHFVSDDVYGEVLDLLGEHGVVELVGLCGYYAMLAMTMNVARTPFPGAPFAIPG